MTKALKEVDGLELEQVAVGIATVSFNPTSTSQQRITRAIENQGYAVAATTR